MIFIAAKMYQREPDETKPASSRYDFISIMHIMQPEKDDML